MYDPSSKDKKQIWLQIARFKPKRPLEGQIMLFATFYMPRPKKHFRTGKYANILKDGVPEYHTNTPDLDNLEKFVLDAYQGKFFKNDSQVVKLSSEKVYGEQDYVYIKMAYTKK